MGPVGALAGAFLLSCVLFGVVLGIPRSRSEPDLAALNERAKALLDVGVSESNRDAVLELLLRKEYGFVPMVSREVHVAGSTWARLGLVSLALLALSIAPKFAVAIGPGKRAFHRWTKWCQLVTYTVPLLVLSTWIWPLTAEALGRLLVGR